MSSIIEIEAELLNIHYPKDFLIDKLKENLKRLENLFQGHVIFYWGNIKSTDSSCSDNLITNEDLEHFRDMLYKRNFKDDLYLIITSPGGRIEAAESIMKYLDKKTKNFYAIVPFMAKSAANLICLMADKIFLGYYSILGSISPLVGDNFQDAIQIIEKLNDLLSYFSKGESTQEFIEKEVQKLSSKENFNEKTERDISVQNRSSQENNDNPQFLSSLPNLFNSIIKSGYPIYAAKESIRWVIEIAYWALKRGKNQLAEDKIKEIINHLLPQKGLKFYYRNMSYEYAKDMGLPVELIEENKYKEHEALILGAQNIMRILADKFDIQKLIAASNGQLFYKVKGPIESVQNTINSDPIPSMYEDHSPKASCSSVGSYASKSNYSDPNTVIEMNRNKESEFERLRAEAKESGKYSKVLDFVFENLEHYSWENWEREDDENTAE